MSVADLALQLADAARARGLIVTRLRASKGQASRSRYLRLLDTRGRYWVLRVSDHGHAIGETCHGRPNWNLVARPGELAVDLAAGAAWLDRVAAGTEHWRNPDPVRPARMHPR